MIFFPPIWDILVGALVILKGAVVNAPGDPGGRFLPLRMMRSIPANSGSGLAQQTDQEKIINAVPADPYGAKMTAGHIHAPARYRHKRKRSS